MKAATSIHNMGHEILSKGCSDETIVFNTVIYSFQWIMPTVIWVDELSIHMELPYEMI